jgi:hypothetical protein
MKSYRVFFAAFALVACTTDEVSFTLPDVSLDASVKDSTAEASRADAGRSDAPSSIPGDERSADDQSTDATSADDGDVSVSPPDAAADTGGDAIDASRADANTDSGAGDDSAGNDASYAGARADGSSNRDGGLSADGGRITFDASSNGPIFDPCAANPQPGFDPLSSGLPACCSGVGPAHCVPATEVIDLLASQLSVCDDPSAVCVPDPIIRAGGTYRAPSCTSSLTASPGACISRCLPFILDNPQSGFLRQDNCEDGDLCVPCTNPFNGTPTGACDLESLLCPTGPITAEGGLESGADASDARPAPDGDAGEAGDAAPRDASQDASTVDAANACPYVGPPLIDPTIFPACSPVCGGAHCVPQAALPVGATSLLATCPSTGGAPGVCAPDIFIAGAGNALPPPCEAFAGTTAAGRCLSTCVPAVQSQPGLEQATCATDSKCVPCNDPFTGADTGVCSIACDQPPAAPFTFAECCPSAGAFDGRCVPRSQIPDSQEPSLLAGTCLNAASLCIPSELLPGGSGPTTCTATATIIPPFTIPYTGTCLSRCLNLGLAAALPQGDCVANHVCVPCAALPETPGCP